MSRRHRTRPDHDRSIWLQLQMAARNDLPITDDDVVRFGHNPEVCLTHLCRESRFIDAGITDLTLGPNDQPAWLEERGNRSVLIVSGKAQPSAEGDGTSPASLWGFLHNGDPVITWFNREKATCLHVGDQYQNFDNLTDVGVKILDDGKLFIWGWKHDDPSGVDRSEAYLWSAGTYEEAQLLGSWSSRIVDGLGVDPDDLFVRFDQHQGLGPANAKKPRGLHSLRLDRLIESSAEVLVILGPPSKLRFLTHFRGTMLQTYRLTKKDATSLRFVDELRLPAPYAGGYCTVRAHLAYKVKMRHEQIAWVIGRDEVQPAMNQVTALFEHPKFGWCYWGSVGQHLCLMQVAFPD